MNITFQIIDGLYRDGDSLTSSLSIIVQVKFFIIMIDRDADSSKKKLDHFNKQLFYQT